MPTKNCTIYSKLSRDYVLSNWTTCIRCHGHAVIDLHDSILVTECSGIQKIRPVYKCLIQGTAEPTDEFNRVISLR